VEANLGTTNLILLVMAVVSVLEALLLIGLALAGYRAYTRTMQMLERFEERHVTPLAARANAILDDLRQVSTTVRDETDRANHAIQSTIDRVDDTVDKVKGEVRARTSRVVGIVRGVRVALETLLATADQPSPGKRRHA
jgi:hypothetical protein